MKMKRFKTSLFGYKKGDVNQYVSELEQKLREQNDSEARVHALEAENARLAGDLKIARAGFVDTAEMMQVANQRLRVLESDLAENRRQLEETTSRLESVLQEKDPRVEELIGLMNRQLEDLGGDSFDALHKVLGDADLIRRIAEGEEGIQSDDPAYHFPQGFSKELQPEEKSARGLMHKIYELRRRSMEEK